MKRTGKEVPADLEGSADRGVAKGIGVGKR